MHTRAGLVVCLLMISSCLFSQYTGGFNDGHVMASVTDISLAIQNALYNGAEGQGHSSSLRLNRSMGITDSMFNGGEGQGYSSSLRLNRSMGTTDSMFNGGEGQGYSSSLRLNRSMGTTDSMFNGGEGQGSHQYRFSNATLSFTDSLFNGGSGRGESVNGKVLNLSLCGNSSTWTGNVSTEWHDPANWDCAAIPGIYSTVVIPAGRPHYPIISYSTEIKQLQLKNGSLVSVNPTVFLILNGQ